MRQINGVLLKTNIFVHLDEADQQERILASDRWLIMFSSIFFHFLSSHSVRCVGEKLMRKSIKNSKLCMHAAKLCPLPPNLHVVKESDLLLLLQNSFLRKRQGSLTHSNPAQETRSSRNTAFSKTIGDGKSRWISSLSLLPQGLNYLHNSEVKVHGNLTSCNCLIDNRWTCKLSGFGQRYLVKGERPDPSTDEQTRYSS